jgi:hypothetical protein
MRKSLAFGSATFACLASAPLPAAETPIFTGSDGVAWSMDKDKVSPLALPGLVQYWMRGVAPAGGQVGSYQIRIYLDCRSRWSVTSALVTYDVQGAIIHSEYKGWATRNWVKPDPAGVIAHSVKLVCPPA